MDETCDLPRDPSGDLMVQFSTPVIQTCAIRLGERTRNTPRPVLSINGMPFLNREVARHGFASVLLLARLSR
jgi:hypothetical protein